MKNKFKIKGFNGKEIELKAHLHLVKVTDFMSKKLHNIGISFTSNEDGIEEPFATFTLNFAEFIGMKNAAYVDTNNCWFADELLEKGIAKDTGLYKVSGMCRYPLWQFTEEFLKAVNEEVYKKYSDEHDKYMREAMPDFCDDEEEDV